jgi:Tfp pilus assembly protein PilP
MRTVPTCLALTFGLHLAAASLAHAQTAPAAAPAAPAPAAPAAKAATALDDYAYRPDGRRDPFISLINAGADPRPTTARRIDGPATFMVGDISVRGVMQTREALVAMVQGPDNRTYLVHQGDKLADGVIKTVTPQGLVVMQDITDPLSTQKQREVRKLLRSLEDTNE